MIVGVIKDLNLKMMNLHASHTMGRDPSHNRVNLVGKISGLWKMTRVLLPERARTEPKMHL
jgi:hypothetical protein